ncbi:uncharacterized protein LOC126664434 isoform X1 [Mercurialis annua]|uniref:uncharacterized protein LOC126664434 isoform X1 n=1 Tax=Mercurialis annua TaxID=3986 RepID=UPI00216087DA|nr:uncharacterized protein LOC126664434 isoform X1 [Mercurialis annua]XP_050212780.1 uncharacterized protein LOC126664434 isoform X1 [Mercurialis annua]
MELEPEIPECPVCLQNYDGENTIPRVLTCGHTTCESCLLNLPQKYPQTIRCPSCIQLVNLPSQGPSSLPKNIDLLRLTITDHNHTTKRPFKESPNQVDSVSPLWSDEFYITWKKWVLQNDAVLLEAKEKDCGFLKDGDKKVRLFKVGDCVLDVKGSGFVFKASYVARIMNFLYRLRDEVRGELSFILGIWSKCCRVCKVYGLWGDLGEGFLYLVCERLNEFVCFENGLSKDVFSSFALMGMEICEAIMGLHLEGLFLGCLSLTCFELDAFGHVHLSLNEILYTGRIVYQDVTEAFSGEKLIGLKEIGKLMSELFKREAFVCPELLLEILKKEKIEVDCGSSFGSAAGSSDVWSLACIFLRLLIGRQFVEEMVKYVDHSVSKVSETDSSDYAGVYKGLIEKSISLLNSKLGDEFKPLQHILCRCLNFDSDSRPSVFDLWKCIRELIIKPEFDTLLRLDKGINVKKKGHFLVLGELSLESKKRLQIHDKDEVLGPENNSGENLDQLEGVMYSKDFFEGLLLGEVKVKDLQGHLDCVTGLAIGGGFLFSSSFDKSVQVWSLQDFSHVHTFKGHEHKVMAVIYVDEKEPLCISADNGGGIILWSITVPLRQEPLKKWHEEKDWRYSGIHALTTAGNGYLYSGSGDRSVKAWSLKDGILSCTMDGHKSVVSALAASDGVLYSGSWDGTIRLWSLTDHSPLTVLGEDMPGTIASVLSLVVRQNMFVAAYENGHVKVWRDDNLMKSMQLHNGAIFATAMEGRYMFTGGWDKTVHVQELSRDEFQMDTRLIGSIPGGAVVTSLLYWQGKLFVGHGDRTIKVYYYGK